MKRIISLIMIVAIAMSMFVATSIVAGAENMSLELISSRMSGINIKDVTVIGSNLYAFVTDDDKYVIYNISDKTINNWRTNNKLKISKTKIDSNIESKDWHILQSQELKKGNYFSIYYANNNDGYTNVVLKYDAESNKLTKVYSTDTALGVLGDGYMSEVSGITSYRTLGSTKTSFSKSLQVNIKDPSAKTIKTIEIASNDTLSSLYYPEFLEFGYNRPYVAAFGHNAVNNDETDSVLLINKKGNVTSIGKSDNVVNFTGGENYIAYQSGNKLYSAIGNNDYTIYLTDTQKSYNVDASVIERFSSEIAVLTLKGFGEKVYGTKAVAQYSYGEDNIYAIIDVATGKQVTDYSYNISTDDGKIFVIMNGGKYKYIDVNGKEYASYDQAGTFYSDGKYAPVIKNKQLYLIDRNMNKVSESISVDNDSVVFTCGKDLYGYSKNGEFYLMTFRDKNSVNDNEVGITLKGSKSGTKVTLSWSKSELAEKYQVYYSVDGGTYKLLKTTTSNKYTIKNLDADKNYKFKVRYYKTVSGKKLYSDYSNVVSIKSKT